jgi:hypothetical protein
MNVYAIKRTYDSSYNITDRSIVPVYDGILGRVRDRYDRKNHARLTVLDGSKHMRGWHPEAVFKTINEAEEYVADQAEVEDLQKQINRLKAKQRPLAAKTRAVKNASSEYFWEKAPALISNQLGIRGVPGRVLYAEQTFDDSYSVRLDS